MSRQKIKWESLMKLLTFTHPFDVTFFVAAIRTSAVGTTSVLINVLFLVLAHESYTNDKKTFKIAIVQLLDPNIVYQLQPF